MYSTWTVAQLKTELRNRGGSLGGRKADLVSRIESFDRNLNFGIPQQHETDDTKMDLPPPESYHDIKLNINRMSSDIVTLLQLDKALSSRVVVVKEISRCDSSFITNCVLNYCIKNKTAVIILSTHNSLQHYQNVGLKMNYNLQRYVDTGLVDYFNIGEYCISSLLSDNNLPQLFPIVKEKVLSMRQKHDAVNVILDGISHLFDLNYTLREVNMLCQELIPFVTCYNNAFILFHCNEAIEDDVSCVMSNLLTHKAHTVLEVENLPSGWSTDVSGHLTIKYPGLKYDNDHMYIMDIKPSRYLFKLFDRGVKLFAPGTV